MQSKPEVVTTRVNEVEQVNDIEDKLLARKEGEEKREKKKENKEQKTQTKQKQNKTKQNKTRRGIL